MKVFISSVVAGYEEFRDAAAGAARALGHEVMRSEDFPALERSPQSACLEGVRWADVVILLLGPRYGDSQESDLSATHQEYREARDRAAVLAFTQTDVELDEAQVRFIAEVRDWTSGAVTDSFKRPEDLRDVVTSALHNLELSRAVRPVDEEEILARAIEGLPEARRGIAGGPDFLILALAGGPKQQVLRPSELEDPQLSTDVMREAMFGASAILDPAKGASPSVSGSRLIVGEEKSSVSIDQLGTVTIRQTARAEQENRTQRFGWSPVLIEEDVREAIERNLRFAFWMLERIDPSNRLSDVAIVACLIAPGTMGWMKRDEAEKARSYPAGNVSDRIIVNLQPGIVRRAALKLNAARLAEDLTVLLRRELRSQPR